MDPAPLPYDLLDPVTITPDRYGGTYSGGAWLAFPVEPSEVPNGPFGGDIYAASWWGEHDNIPIGRGATPDLAYSDLLHRLEALPPSHERQPANRFGSWIFTWDLAWPSGRKSTVIWHWRGEGHGPRQTAQGPKQG